MDDQRLLEYLVRTIYAYRNEESEMSLAALVLKLYKGCSPFKFEEEVNLCKFLTREHVKRFVEFIDQESDAARVRLTHAGVELAKEAIRTRYRKPQSLFSWCFFLNNFDAVLEQLAEMANPENWDDGESRYGILRHYISNTFLRLLHEKRDLGNQLAIVEGEKWAAFNTGLLTRLFNPIYALVTLNQKPDMQKWVFHSWCTPGYKRAGQTLARCFRQLPSPASYFDSPYDLVYHPDIGDPTLPFEHILDRLQRLPSGFLRAYAPPGIEVPNVREKPADKFFENYRRALVAPENRMACLHFKDALEVAITRSVQRVKTNYRLAMPVYDAKRCRMLLLLPLFLDPETTVPDAALMVERARSGNYVGHTILTTGMAYKKVRMIMNPSADWLYYSMVKGEEAVEDEDPSLNQEISENDKSAREENDVQKHDVEMQVYAIDDDETTPPPPPANNHTFIPSPAN